MIFKLKTSYLPAMLLLTASLFIFPVESFAEEAVKLTAEPVEVAAGSGFGKTRIRWETTETINEARLYFVKEDGSLVPVGKGKTGEFRENYILPGKTYEYRLYPAENLDLPLAALNVVGTRNVNYAPDVSTAYKKVFKPWIAPLIAISLLLFFTRYPAQRNKNLKLQKILPTAAIVLALIGAVVVISKERGLPFEKHPEPDAQETMDAAYQMYSGNGYVTGFHGGELQPPRYPPGFSIALLPFLNFGEYPANVIFGAKIFTLAYLFLAMFAAWKFGGKMAAMTAVIFVGVSPFAEHYARIVMTEAFTASLILVIIVLLQKPSLWKVIFAGAIAGFLITVRLQMLICLPALLLALPSMRLRFWAAIASAPFLLANGVFNWKTFGSFFKTGYDYWLPHVKPFAWDFAFRTYPQGDGPWIIPDMLQGWLMVWICPCDKGGTVAALPTLLLYPLILLGVFWMFAPPFATAYGLWSAWKKRSETVAKFALWICGFSLLLFTFYFYQAARFMTAASTLLLIFAAVGIGKKIERFILPDSVPDSAMQSNEAPASDDKICSSR